MSPRSRCWPLMTFISSVESEAWFFFLFFFFFLPVNFLVPSLHFTLQACFECERTERWLVLIFVLSWSARPTWLSGTAGIAESPVRACDASCPHSLQLQPHSVRHDGNHRRSGWWRNHDCHTGRYYVGLAYWLIIAVGHDHQQSGWWRNHNCQTGRYHVCLAYWLIICVGHDHQQCGWWRNHDCHTGRYYVGLAYWLIIAVGHDHQQSGWWRNHNCQPSMSGGCFICCWLLLLDIIIKSLAGEKTITVTQVCLVGVSFVADYCCWMWSSTVWLTKKTQLVS